MRLFFTCPCYNTTKVQYTSLQITLDVNFTHRAFRFTGGEGIVPSSLSLDVIPDAVDSLIIEDRARLWNITP